ncbi:RNA-splicing factor [Pichia californica]|nr:RNA-splicing factor [[Candida] californica]
MSYNGIGLKSVKGSSTSGFVQRNAGDSQIRSGSGESQGKQFYGRQLVERRNERVEKQRKVSSMTMDYAIWEHEKKRQIEIKAMEYRDELEQDDNLTDEKIDELVNKFRNNLLKSKQPKKSNWKYNDREKYAYNKAMNPFTKETCIINSTKDKDSNAIDAATDTRKNNNENIEENILSEETKD